MYQGHHSDGSSIQKHSCGETYPFVIGYTERGGYSVVTPSGDWIPMGKYSSAFDKAMAMKLGKGSQPEARDAGFAV